MELKHLTILVESQGSAMRFDGASSGDAIIAMFNPSKLTLSRSVQWQNQKAAKRDNPEMQFTGAEPATLNVDLLFDTYDTPEPESAKQSVKTTHTDKLLHLTTVEKHGDKHRPPVCRLQWGDQGIFFQGVLQQLETPIHDVHGGRHSGARHRAVHVQAVARQYGRFAEAGSHVLGRSQDLGCQARPVTRIRRGGRIW